MQLSEATRLEFDPFQHYASGTASKASYRIHSLSATEATTSGPKAIMKLSARSATPFVQFAARMFYDHYKSSVLYCILPAKDGVVARLPCISVAWTDHATIRVGSGSF